MDYDAILNSNGDVVLVYKTRGLEKVRLAGTVVDNLGRIKKEDIVIDEKSSQYSRVTLGMRND